MIEIRSFAKTRKIACLGTAAGNPYDAVATSPRWSGNHNPRWLDQRACHEHGRLRGRQKIGIGCGTTYPTVAKAVEKYEVVMVTGVGKPVTQAWLSADAKAGDTNITGTHCQPGRPVQADFNFKVSARSPLRSRIPASPE